MKHPPEYTPRSLDEYIQTIPMHQREERWYSQVDHRDLLRWQEDKERLEQALRDYTLHNTNKNTGKSQKMNQSLPIVTNLVQTCSACPSQWEGRTHNGQYVYVRYRWGSLTMGISSVSLDDAIKNQSFEKTLGDKTENMFDGYLDTEDMMKELQSVLKFAIKIGKDDEIIN